MSLQEEIEILQMVDFFSDFNSEQLNLVAFASKKLKYLPDVEIYNEGQSASGGYVIMDGSVELVRKKAGEFLHSGIFERGSMLSEMALVTPTARRNTARTATHAVLLSIPRSVMLRVISEYPELAVSIKAKIQSSMMSLVQDIQTVPKKLNQNQIQQ